jgi:hypothetical protein
VKLKLLARIVFLTRGVLTGAEVPAQIEDARITPTNKLPPRGNPWPHPDAESAKISSDGEGLGSQAFASGSWCSATTPAPLKNQWAI